MIFDFQENGQLYLYWANTDYNCEGCKFVKISSGAKERKLEKLVRELKKALNKDMKDKEKTKIVLSVQKGDENKELELSEVELCHLAAMSLINWRAKLCEDFLFNLENKSAANAIAQNYKNGGNEQWEEFRNLTKFLGFKDNLYTDKKLPATPEELIDYEIGFNAEDGLFRIGCKFFTFKQLNEQYNKLFSHELVSSVSLEGNNKITRRGADEILAWAKEVQEITGCD